MSTPKLPHPYSPDWPAARNAAVARFLPKILAHLEISPFLYQHLALFPPEPYEIDDIRLIIFEGATRVGKSIIEAVRASVTPFIPGYTTRLYGWEHENCEREFRHIRRMLIDPNNPKALCHKYPELIEGLDHKYYNDNPDSGRLVMRWGWGSEIKSMSWQRKSQWRGEAIDLALICEPGLFKDGSVYSGEIRNRLTDLRGVCLSAGTADTPWMKAFHDLAHDHENHPDILCICEIPQWANPILKLKKRDIELMKDQMAPRDFAINVLGKWENWSNIAYERFDPNNPDIVKVVPRRMWETLKRNEKSWDHFLCIDTGRHCACGQFLIGPQGQMLMIDEWTNYTYKGGQTKPALIDDRGFASWMADILSEVQERLGVNRNRPAIWGDPSSQFKQDVGNLGYGFVDAVNAHDYGVNTFNEYLAKKKFMIVRPEGRGPYTCEYELPMVRWAETPSGESGRHRLEKGTDNDHAADVVRYAAASRPLGFEFTPEPKPSIIERDIEATSNRGYSDKHIDEFMGIDY